MRKVVLTAAGLLLCTLTTFVGYLYPTWALGLMESQLPPMQHDLLVFGPAVAVMFLWLAYGGVCISTRRQARKA